MYIYQLCFTIFNRNQNQKICHWTLNILKQGVCSQGAHTHIPLSIRDRKTLVLTLLSASILILAKEDELSTDLWKTNSDKAHLEAGLQVTLGFPPQPVLFLLSSLQKPPHSAPSTGAGSRCWLPGIPAPHFPCPARGEPDSCSKVEKFSLAEEPVLRKLFNSSSISTC